METVEEIRRDQYVLIHLTSNKRWLVKVTSGFKIHTHKGYINMDSLIGLKYGSSVTSSLGVQFWALKPTVQDFILKGERRTQVVYPKDLGMIAAKTGISSGMVVVEAGTGSGALTTFLANLVKPGGRVYTYEIRPDFIEVAKRNVEKAGLTPYVTFNQKDVKEGFDIKDADVGIIDVGDPWTIVKPMWAALKGSGFLVSISPTINQVEKMVSELSKEGFIDIESLEVLVRGVEARVGMSRPSMRMIGHTAYLTFARKILPPDKY